MSRARAGSKDDAVALVKKAADYVKTYGLEKALKEFNNPHSPFVKDDLYVFAQDTGGVMRAHPQKQVLVGKYVADLKDANGKFFGKEIMDMGKSKGSGWVDYDWMNPATDEVEEKSTYLLRSDNMILCCGVYR